jgi:hypothetical protein
MLQTGSFHLSFNGKSYFVNFNVNKKFTCIYSYICTLPWHAYKSIRCKSGMDCNALSTWFTRIEPCYSEINIVLLNTVSYQQEL